MSTRIYPNNISGKDFKRPPNDPNRLFGQSLGALLDHSQENRKKVFSTKPAIDLGTNGQKPNVPHIQAMPEFITHIECLENPRKNDDLPPPPPPLKGNNRKEHPFYVQEYNPPNYEDSAPIVYSREQINPILKYSYKDYCLSEIPYH